MENEVDLSSSNPLDLTPKGSLAIENLDTIKPISPQQPIQLAQNSTPMAQAPSGMGQGLFGTNKLNVSPTPEDNYLDNAEALKVQRLKNLQEALGGPKGAIAQFLYPDEAKEWAKEAAQTSLELNQIKQQRQQQKDIAEQGAIGGIAPGTMPANATQETLINNLTKRYRETGDVNTQKALIAAKRQDLVETYMPDAVAAQEAKAETHKAVIQELNKATDQASYNSLLQKLPKELRNDPDIPKNYNGPGGWVSKRGQAFNDNLKALQMVNTFKQQQANQQDFTDIQDEKLATQMGKSGPKLSNGEPMTGFTPVNHLGNGAIGWRGPQRSDDISKYGAKDDPKSWGVFDNTEAVQKQMETAVPKNEREKLILQRRMVELATTRGRDENGNLIPLPPGQVNTNPTILQAVDEGMASAFRGINGSANVGLVKLELIHRGVAQDLADKMTAAWAGGKGVFTGKEGEYLTKLSQEQKRYVIDFLNDYTKADVAKRLGGIAEKVGMKGGQLDEIGLEPELQKLLEARHAFGRDKEKLRLSNMVRVIRAGEDSVFLQPGKASLAVPGATVTPLPLSALPGLTPGTSDARSENGTLPSLPTAPATSSPPPGGGGGTNPAAGISKDYLIKTAKIESNGSWTEGNSKTSASGAFQFIKSTWDQFKPPGAPDRAADATPQQQTEAANALTNANAKVLAARGVPVNDTTAYMAHNLGAGGAVSLIKADNNADARKVVGEEAAKNNPLFFKGNPTVGEVKERYAKAMSGTALTAKQAEENYYKAASEVPKKLANIAPAIGSVVGGVGGTALGGPLGGAAGAVGGGAAGGAVRQAVLGGPGYVDQTIRGAAEGIPMAVPGIGPARIAARVAAGGAVPAAEKLYDTGGQDVAGAIESGAAGAVGGAVGEGLGIFGHHAMSMWGPGPAKKMIAAANDLVDEPPKIANAAGKMVDNPKFIEAERKIKASKFDPDQVAHDVRAMREGVPKGEALAKRPAEIERIAAGKELEAVKQDVVAAGTAQNVGTLKPAARLPGDPQSLIDTGKIDKSYQKTVDWAQMSLNAPANVDGKWNQLGEVRTKLLKWERDPKIPVKDQEAYREIANSMRDQQIALVKMVHTDANGKVTPAGVAVINHLKAADARYARAMAAGAGENGDIVAAIAKGGKEGREAQAAFNAVAANDPQAQRMVRSLAEMEKSLKERAMGAGAVLGVSAALAHFGGPVGAVAGGLLTANKVKQMLGDYMAKRGAGAPVTFKTILDRELGRMRRAGSVIGSSIGGQAAQ